MVGALIGLGIGLFAPRLVSSFSGLPTHVLPLFPAVALMVAISVGVTFGIYPACAPHSSIRSKH